MKLNQTVHKSIFQSTPVFSHVLAKCGIGTPLLCNVLVCAHDVECICNHHIVYSQFDLMIFCSPPNYMLSIVNFILSDGYSLVP